MKSSDMGVVKSVNWQWTMALAQLVGSGKRVMPRGQGTSELIGYQTTVDMSRPVLTVPEREMGYKFQAAEAWWILSGDERVETIAPYSKVISQFSDDGVVFAGAYGPKVFDQLSYVKRCLDSDSHSRQAIINIWRETPGPSRDVPCTLSLQFLLRDGKLDCVASMRSSDIWLGWVYDVFNFSCIASTVAAAIVHDAELGTLRLTAGSQHLYDRDRERAERVLDKFSSRSLDDSPTLPVMEYTCLVKSLKSMADGPGSLEGLRNLKI